MFNNLRKSTASDQDASLMLSFSLSALPFGLGLLIAAQMLFGVGSWAMAWTLLALLCATTLIIRGMKISYPHSVFGMCNAVTLLRAVLVVMLFGALFDPTKLSAWIVFGLALLALCLDGFDGWLARRSGLMSDFGARFDMETDAALGAVLAVWLLITSTTGPLVLILGFMRYAFVVVGWFIPALRKELAPSFRRKLICVVQIASLVILICPWTPDMAIPLITVLASGALTYSFAVDMAWLMRAQR